MFSVACSFNELGNNSHALPRSSSGWLILCGAVLPSSSATTGTSFTSSTLRIAPWFELMGSRAGLVLQFS
ncbi:hypothetical protein SLEP1_g760 [Rubroshorea leprosula]|uniref:Uncharacterized protein n=1 Tax=Rubroshorea leprosula TaxID=152421 RepID=A0AAV5HH81_9ROSI|nr:hypothetical protein SLEP1_g760 [Rubroshorea leprosula]